MRNRTFCLEATSSEVLTRLVCKDFTRQSAEVTLGPGTGTSTFSMMLRVLLAPSAGPPTQRLLQVR